MWIRDISCAANMQGERRRYLGGGDALTAAHPAAVKCQTLLFCVRLYCFVSDFIVCRQSVLPK